MEVNGCLKMILISKSIGHLDDGLDLGINPFTDSIGDSIPKVRKHILKVTMERSSYLDDGLQSRMGCPKVPPLEMSRGPSSSGIVPEVPETLFDCPCPSGFQVASLQPLKALPVLLRKVFLTVKPKILRLGQRLVSHLLQRPMLSLAHRIHGLTHMGHQMVTVKDNLLFRLRYIVLRRGNVRVPNIHGHGLNPLPLLLRKPLIIAIQTPLLTIIGKILHRPRIQVTNQREILVPLPNRLLIHTDPGTRPLSSGQQPSLDRSLHEAPRLVPTDPQNPSRPQDVTLPKYIDRPPHKQQREPRTLLAPRQPHLPYPMLSTVNPRRAGVKKRLELTTVQMTPRSLRSMVIQRCQDSTFRTGPTDLSQMGRPHIHPLILQIQRHPFHRPRFFNAQQVTVKFSVLHGSSPPWSHFTLNYHPLKTRMNQIC